MISLARLLDFARGELLLAGMDASAVAVRAFARRIVLADERGAALGLHTLPELVVADVSGGPADGYARGESLADVRVAPGSDHDVVRRHVAEHVTDADAAVLVRVRPARRWDRCRAAWRWRIVVLRGAVSR